MSLDNNTCLNTAFFFKDGESTKLELYKQSLLTIRDRLKKYKNVYNLLLISSCSRDDLLQLCNDLFGGLKSYNNVITMMCSKIEVYQRKLDYILNTEPILSSCYGDDLVDNMLDYISDPFLIKGKPFIKHLREHLRSIDPKTSKYSRFDQHDFNYHTDEYVLNLTVSVLEAESKLLKALSAHVDVLVCSN